VERVTAGAANLAEFERLYSMTMDRHRAADRWYFPGNYFRNCARFLGEERVALFFARVERAVASAYLLLHDEGIVYYHFGGSDQAYFSLRPNNLLLYGTALWAKQAGNRIYHLGGGVTSEAADNLLRFKSGFGGKSATLYTYGRIHDRAAYQSLCELKLSHERATPGAKPDSGYFPLYRR
jgi:lipid II:glycine glycyltransferase (peptidoglycan interpeptide bridge formation enzyme)